MRRRFAKLFIVLFILSIAGCSESIATSENRLANVEGSNIDPKTLSDLELRLLGVLAENPHCKGHNVVNSSATRLVWCVQQFEEVLSTTEPEEIVNLLSYSNDYLRFACQTVLSEIGENTIAALDTAMESDSLRLRFEAMRIKHKITGSDPEREEITAVLNEIIKDENEVVYPGDNFLLADNLCSEPGSLIEPLKFYTRLLASEFPDTQVDALLTLGDMGPDARSAVPSILKLLETEDSTETGYRFFSPDFTVHSVVAWALGEIGTDNIDIVSELRELADSNELSVRLYASGALFKLGYERDEILQFIISALTYKEDPLGSYMYRQNALWILGDIGPDAKDALPYLYSLLEGDENPLISKILWVIDAIESEDRNKPLLSPWSRLL